MADFNVKPLSNLPSDLKKFFKNVSWLTIEKIFRSFINIFIWIWIANYLGPANFGILNYCITIVIILIPLSSLGIDSLVVKKIVNNEGELNSILGTSFIIKIIGSGFVILFSLIFIVLFESSSENYLLFCFIISLSSIFQTIDIFDYYYQARLKQKLTSVSKIFSFSISTIIKILLIIFNAELVFFAIVYTFEIFVYGIFMFIIRDNSIKILKWTTSAKEIKKLINDSFPLFLSNIAIIFILKIDLLIMKQILGEYELGLYSFAVKLTEPLFMLISIISISYFPIMINKKGDFNLKLKSYFNWITKLSYVIILSFSIPINLYLLYVPSAYSEAIIAIDLRVLTILFISLEGVMNTWYLSNGDSAIKLKMKRNIVGLLLNVFLNIYLIESIGLNGAAISFLISYTLISLIMNIFNKKTRPIFFMQLRAVFLVN